MKYGILQSVTDTTDTATTCGSTCTLWTANAMNGLGQITQETLGNGVVMNRAYDPVTSWLTAATGGVGGGATLLNQSYLQDENGNVIQRQDNNQGLTESFAYDADNRIVCDVYASTCSGTTNYAYDGGSAGPGNLTANPNSQTLAYPAAGQPQPHAVTSLTGTFNGIVNPTFSYDANGNMTNRASATQNITWSSYNYPTAISGSDATGSEEVQLFYGPDRQRWEQIYTVSGTTEKTYYIGGLIDLVFNGGTTNYRHYIYAGNEPVAIYSRTAAGVNTMSYMLEDHLGGVSAITSSTGTTDVNESFSAFGTRRNPTTWSGAPTTSDLNTIASLSRQGFTFQTALGQSMGLNHMNGRVEDAILGRFLSPDPHIPNTVNAQSYNRYSYVLNNPLTGVDPTGFKDCYPVSTCPEELWHGGDSGSGWGLGGGMGDGFDDIFGPSSADLSDGSWTLWMATNDDSSNSSGGTGTPSTPSDPTDPGSPTTDPTNSTPGDSNTTVLAQSQAGTDACAAGGCLPEQTVTAQSGGATVWNDPNDATAGIVAVGYSQSALHDLVQAQMTAYLRSGGWKVVNGPTICLPGAQPCGQPDIFGLNPSNGMLFAIEIKTGFSPALTPGQLNIYPHLGSGGVLVSADPQLTQFGIYPGQSLPPVDLLFYYQLNNDGPGILKPSPWSGP
jgi:RHS repeat-associated protein